MAKSRPHVTQTDQTHAGEKRFPDGLKVLIHSIWQIWPFVAGETQKQYLPVSDLKNGTSINEKAKLLQGKFPDANIPPNAARALYKIGTGEEQLKYWHLRLAAEYVDIYTGLLVTYGQLISIERETKDPQEQRTRLLAFVADIESFVGEVRTVIESETAKPRGRFAYDHGVEGYLANINTLKQIVDAIATNRSKSGALPEATY